MQNTSLLYMDLGPIFYVLLGGFRKSLSGIQGWAMGLPAAV